MINAIPVGNLTRYNQHKIDIAKENIHKLEHVAKREYLTERMIKNKS